MVNVGKYTIHGSYGVWIIFPTKAPIEPWEEPAPFLSMTFAGAFGAIVAGLWETRRQIDASRIKKTQEPNQLCYCIEFCKVHLSGQFIINP